MKLKQENANTYSINNDDDYDNDNDDSDDIVGHGCGFCPRPLPASELDPNILSLHFRSALSPFPVIKLVFVEPQSVWIKCTIEHETSEEAKSLKCLLNKSEDA